MVTLYEALLAVHVLGAVVWVGGAIALQVLDFRAAREGLEAAEAHLRDAEFVGTRVFIPASLVVLAAGIGLVVEGNRPLEAWIVFGLAVWAASFLSGAFFLGPQSSRIFRDAEVRGLGDPTIARRLRRLRLVSRIEDYLLVLAVLDMVLKPGA